MSLSLSLSVCVCVSYALKISSYFSNVSLNFGPEHLIQTKWRDFKCRAYFSTLRQKLPQILNPNCHVHILIYQFKLPSIFRAEHKRRNSRENFWKIRTLKCSKYTSIVHLPSSTSKSWQNNGIMTKEFHVNAIIHIRSCCWRGKKSA